VILDPHKPFLTPPSAPSERRDPNITSNVPFVFAPVIAEPSSPRSDPPVEPRPRLVSVMKPLPTPPTKRPTPPNFQANVPGTPSSAEGVDDTTSEAVQMNNAAYIDISTFPSSPRISSTPPKCAGCMKEFQSHEAPAHVRDLLYHPACFKCSLSLCP